MSAHTPGPWIHRRSDEWSHSVVTQHGELPNGEPNYWAIASINKHREPEHEANARLIAAAPELLRALEKAAEHIEAMMAHIEGKPQRFQAHCWQQALDARAAIAKATGAA